MLKFSQHLIKMVTKKHNAVLMWYCALYCLFSIGPPEEEMFFDIDAALIKLPDSSFDLDHFVNVICLPNKFGPIDESWNGKMLTITGFGRIKNKVVPRRLQLGQKCMMNIF